jgi:hypothetical protein
MLLRVSCWRQTEGDHMGSPLPRLDHPIRSTAMSSATVKWRLRSSAKNGATGKYSSGPHTPGFIGDSSISLTPIARPMEVPGSE